MEKEMKNQNKPGTERNHDSADLQNRARPQSALQKNECPIKDRDGNCLVPGIYSDSEPIGGG